ncbi:hypothetical protein [Burkholderia ubonensis]|uniref:hypothetical protein n=1 Tax=Burkholderia ubonensis TaxID=101571 RepID=UPI00075A0035|nr:hypothetical protein [Burkholderia ubonensis]
MTFEAYLIGVFIACVVATSVHAAGPSADYTLDPDWTRKSPDGATTIEQYKKHNADESLLWQLWARHQNKQTLLVPEQSFYPAEFRFTADSKWVVRMQKTGSGEATLYLYRLGPRGFVRATKQPLGDLAWAYLKRTPEWMQVKKPDFHLSADLLEAADENYHSLGVNWPASRYLLIALSGNVATKNDHAVEALNGWLCRYDLQTGKFDVPPVLSRHNAKVLQSWPGFAKNPSHPRTNTN